MKIWILVNILNISFLGSLASADEKECPLYLVDFWTDFSERHGINSVPAFLIKNGCMKGSNEIVIAYDEYQNFLDNSLDEYSYLGSSYEANYYAENDARENVEERGVLKINEEISKQQIENEIKEDFQLIRSSKVHLENIPVADSKEQKNYQPISFNLYLLTATKNEIGYSLMTALISIIIFGLILLSKNNNKKNIHRQYKEKVCHDCGSKLKPDKTQCFTCGSYV